MFNRLKGFKYRRFKYQVIQTVLALSVGPSFSCNFLVSTGKGNPTLAEFFSAETKGLGNR
jgi:hypothetical protein